MADSYEPMRRPARAPLRAAARRRWLMALGVGGLWLVLLAVSGSLVVATVMLVLLVMLAAVCVVGLRCLGIDGDHPWVQQLAVRPWRDGRDVLRLGLRHLPDVFLVSPSGSLLAPNAVELRMNPDDLASLTGMMDLDLINSSAAEVYAAQVADLGARVGSDGPVDVRVIGDPAVPAGRYRLRQGRPVSSGPPVAAGPPVSPGPPVTAGPPVSSGPPVAAGPPVSPEPAVSAAIPASTGAPFNAHDGWTQGQQAGARTMATGLMTATAAPPIPPLRLVTNGSVVETRLPRARAGRGSGAELLLPAEPTVSRVHARFDFAGGQWWITNLGRNGIMLNGVPLAGERAVNDGDAIAWGVGREALTSRVEVG